MHWLAETIIMLVTLRRALPALLIAVPLLAFILYPTLALLADSVRLPVAEWRAQRHGFDPAQPPGTALRILYKENGARQALWGTLKLTTLTVVCGGLWGLGLALLWGRRDFPLRRVFALAGYAPLLMPPLIGTLAFFRLLGEGGLLAQLSGGKPWLSPFANVLALHTYSFGLYTYAFTAAALESLDATQEEAVRGLGGGKWAVFRNAVWPAIRAPLAAAALLTYMAAGASYSAPLILDTNGSYLTVEIVNEKLAGDPAFVSALTVLLAALSLAALPPFLYFQRHTPDSAAGSKGQARGLLPMAAPLESAVRLALSVLAVLVLLAPLLTVALGAFTPKEEWYATWPSRLALESFRKLDAGSMGALVLSLKLAIAAAALDMLIAIAVALALRRAPAWAGLPAEVCVTLAVALPGTAVAIALLAAFNAPTLLTGGLPLGQTAAILILAYAVRCLPLAVRPVRAMLHNLGGDFERAARGLGAGPLRTLFKVTLPLLLPTLLAAGLICFVTSAGEFVASEILYGPATVPVSVQIGILFRNNDPPVATALGLCLLGLGAVAVTASAWLQARASLRRGAKA